MAVEYRKISFKDFGSGVDARSAPSAIGDAYSEVLLNADVNSNGFISKRVGYEGYNGYLPLRVLSVSHSGTEITFTLDGSVDTKSLTATPLVVYGKLSGSQSGDWSNTNNAEYYTTFTTDIPDTWVAASSTDTLLESRHGVNSANAFIQVLINTSLSNNNNTLVYPDRADISTSDPYDVDFEYTLAADTDVFLLVSDKSTGGGDNYAGTDTITAASTETYTISAATHALDNFNIIGQCYYQDGTEWVQFFPDSFTVDSSGDVEVSVTNSGASDLTIKVVLSAAAAANTTSASISSGSTGTITISSSDEFLFVGAYQNSGGTLTQIIPDSVVFDDSANTTTVTITNSTGSNQNYVLYWEAATLTTSALVVTDNSGTNTSYTDSSPQLTIWGIPHSGLYTTSSAQEGHVTHIDSYRRDSEERLVAGLGGNLFTARTRAESGDGYLIPSSETSLEARLASDVDIAPLFATTGSSATRTRGLVTADDVDSSGRAIVTGVSLVSSGVTRYTLQLTNKSGDLSTALSVSSTTPDYLTVTGMANSVHNGTFQITAVDNTNNTITVSNSAAKLSDLDETGAMGRAAVYTDQITLAATSDFLNGDSILATVFSTISPAVVASSGTTVVVSGVTASVNIASGQRIFGSRSARVIPLASVTNFVKGDMCSVTDLTRRVRVKYVVTGSDKSISSITGDGTTATVTLSDAHTFEVGQRVLILRTGTYDGEQVITSLPSTTTFTFASAATTTVNSGILKAGTIEIDEALTVQDDGSSPTTFSVVGRWIPVEAPTSDDSLPASTYVRHLDADGYTAQDRLRSVMVGDNLYLTNYNDEVLKFDGTNIYQAGLFRWQPQLFMQLDTTTTSIPVSRIKATYSAIDSAANKFTVDTAALFVPGDIIVDEDTGTEFTVSQVDVTNKLIFVIEDTSSISTGGSPANNLLRKATRFNYYFRLNAIDANNNVIASAATGVADFVDDLTASGQVKMRLVGMPAWGNYDYDRLELQVYRSKSNTSAPFYLVRTLDVSFDAGDGYIDLTDGTIDDLLIEFDEVNTALKGAEIGTAWTQPLRAKYITTADNRLILANLRDYPEIDIVLRKKASAASITASDLSGKRFLFRKDNTDTATTTNMVDRVAYEFVTSGATTITPATDITRNSTSFTVATSTPPAVGSWVYLFHSAAGTVNKLDFAGWFQVASVVASTSFTVNFNNSSTPSSNDVDRFITATAPADVPVWLGTDGNYNQLDGNTINEFRAMLRLCNAINASMRLTDTSISGQSSFTPWMVASAGSEIGVGRLIVRQEKVLSTTMEVLLPAAVTTGDWFVGGLRKTASSENTATTRVFPSRIIASYPNYPEIFDAPYGDEATSDSVIDVNAADGQEITGVIPFFGEAVFGSGQMESVIVVFKTNAIYLLDLNSKQLSKIQSRGLGCTAPYSIASTRDGIMFANESGVYRLNRDQSISYVGKFIERIWQDDVDRDYLSVATGHHYGVGGKYKLSVPVGNDQATNNYVLVYDHQREGLNQEFGAWTEYTNHNATGWANLGDDAYFATTDGQVFKVRRAGDSTDFRDDGSAVEMTVVLRAEDFGMAGARKIIHGVVSHFHLRRSSMNGTTLSASYDLDGSYSTVGAFSFTKDATVKVETANASLGRRRCTYIQLKYTNSTKDEDVVLAGVDYNVAALGVHGVPDRSETT